MLPLQNSLLRGTICRAFVVMIGLGCACPCFAAPVAFQFTAEWDQDFNGALAGEEITGRYTFDPVQLVFTNPQGNVGVYSGTFSDIAFEPIQVGADLLEFLPGGTIRVLDNGPDDSYGVQKAATLGGVEIEDGVSFAITGPSTMFPGIGLPTDPSFFSVATTAPMRLGFDELGVPDPTLTLTSLTAVPVDLFWNNPAGGFYTQTTNWNPDFVPIADDNAIYGLDATYSVEFIGGGASRAVTVSDGDVAFQPVGNTVFHHVYTIGVSTTVDGGDLTLSGNGTDTFELTGGDLTVGDAGDGRLTIQNGGGASIVCGVVGNLENSMGQVTVTGPDATWALSQQLRVGEDGSGTLRIENQGTVSSNSGTIGAQPTGVGEVTVDGAGSTLTMSGSLSVGFEGRGTLLIDNEGTVSSSTGTIGNNEDGVGEVTVDGAGSMWTMTGDLYVGEEGTGNLTIKNGGLVDVATNATLAVEAGSVATLAFGIGDDGTGTIASGLLNVDDTLTRGDGSALFDLSVENGVSLEVGNQFTLIRTRLIQLGFAFDNLSDDDLIAVDEYEFQVDFDADLGGGDFGFIATVTNVVRLAGDYNADGVVDAADYTVWRDAVGTDFDLRGNGDESGASAGVVNGADYDLWVANFGNTAFGGAALNLAPGDSPGANHAVPEPATWWLAMLVTAAWLSLRRGGY